MSYLPGIGDDAVDLTQKWVDDIKAYIRLQITAGKSQQEIATFLASPAGAQQFGYLGTTLPSDWVNRAMAEATAKSTSGGLTTRSWVVGIGVVLGAVLLLRKKKR